MRIPALLLAIFIIAVSTMGFVAPDRMTELRRSYYTVSGLYIAGAVRVAMGLVWIFAASSSRAPKILTALGAIMCLQGITANILGLEHARTVLEWETMHTALLRTGAAVAIAASTFVASALLQRTNRQLATSNTRQPD